jgi:C4-dicarboxylate-specific signal transduction histidine kinase
MASGIHGAARAAELPSVTRLLPSPEQLQLAGTAATGEELSFEPGRADDFEQQLSRSGKLASLGELAASVAHEINNRPFAIVGLVEFLLRDAEPSSKAAEQTSSTSRSP